MRQCTAPNCPSLDGITRCTYRGCELEPVNRVVSDTPGCMHWHGCEEHTPGMVKAFKYGGGMFAEATVFEIPVIT